MIIKQLFFYSAIIIALFFNLNSCNKSPNNSSDYPDSFPGPKHHFLEIASPEAPNYADARNWMLIPEDENVFGVDLIWLNPTTFVSDSLWNMPMNNEAAKQGALNDFRAMSGIFEESCNMYSPYYRQACLAVLSADGEDFEAAFNLAYTDVTRALDYYFEYYNDGRKFIIAGHSQGANHALELLKNNKILNAHIDNMIAAYVVGWSLTNEDLLNYPQLNICDSASEQGCIITYNTIEDGYQEEAESVTLLPNSITVNPLLWNTSKEFAPKTLHEGAVFKSATGFDTLYQYSSAQNRNGLCVERPVNVDDFLVFEPYFHPGIYHVYDYEFFHLNLKNNLKERIAASK
ncbi:MAG: DUF3089 domain-containing protein [Prolixibacteraceae bacterium]|jgi:hypothetical protein|nr:DUF3089 domain-containing protein [Prolixibacteraceae bacterium]